MQTPDAPNIKVILENLFTPRTVDFKSIIEAHLFSDISLTELAQLNYMSMSSFKRKFKEIYQASPGQYINGQKLKKSKQLLTLSDQSIGDIAYSCGFKSMSHFSKKFKEACSVSPSKYRLDHLEK